MARFRYRNHQNSGRFPVSPPDRTPASRAAQARQAPPAVPTGASRHHHAPPRRHTHRTGLGVVTPQTTDAWRELLAPDGSPLALPFQVDFVRRAVWQQTGLRPSLRGLTIGQAVRILRAINVDPKPLWHSGRDNWAMTVLAMSGKWIAFAALFMLILGVGRADGAPFVLLILLGLGLSAARRQRRQLFEERYYRRRDGQPRPPRAALRAARRAVREAARDAAKRPALPASPSAPPDGGDPYDVETYLRRLHEEGR
ncbi:hypothetical protein [Sinomonas sp. P47F7]|uniref:hypothetical protein n=1 Tax=Sinomonas sp. P47F7 TaxID=3410987 RepID=UPI003BF5BA46